eukprot:361765_1
MEFKVASSNSITEMRGSWYGSRHSNLLAQRVLKRMGLMNLWIIASHPTININNDKANTIIIAFSSIIETDYIGAAVDLRKSGIPFLLCFVCGSYKGLHGVFDENENIGCVDENENIGTAVLVGDEMKHLLWFMGAGSHETAAVYGIRR